MFRAVIYFGLVAFTLSSKGVQWKYGESVYGPKDWNKVSAHCSETAQSPVNIDTSTVKEKPNLKGLSFAADNKRGKVSGILTNNGHAPTLKIDKPKGTTSLTGGPLGDSVYKLEQLHFHFGCDDDEGSEHTVNGQAFSGELHLVTFNAKYPDFNTTADKPDGLAVIGVFFQKNAKLNSRFATRLASLIRKIRKADSSVAVRSLALFKLVPELADLSKASFYSYKGSLTTPPCYQSVSWIVLKNPVDVGTDMLKALRKLKNHEKHSLCGNFRPTQPLNDRTVSVHPE